MVRGLVEFSGLGRGLRVHLGDTGKSDGIHVRCIPSSLRDRRLARYGGLSSVHMDIMCNGLVRQ